MEALKRLTLALTVALVGVACGDDDEPGTNGMMDGSVKTPDAGIDGGGGLKLDGAVLACNAGTRPTATKCGGSECQSSEAEIRANAVANATCGGEVEVKSFCSLEAVKNVGDCTSSTFLGGLSPSTEAPAFNAAVKTCAATKQPATFSSTCLDCFVESGRCAADKCINECLADNNSDACTLCRIEKGCISSFYTCAGLKNPLDALTR